MIQYSFQEAACLDIVIDSHDKIFNRNVGIMALITCSLWQSFNFILLHMPGILDSDQSFFCKDSFCRLFDHCLRQPSSYIAEPVVLLSFLYLK